MSLQIESVRLTTKQLALLERANDGVGSSVSVGGADLCTGRQLHDKGLGWVAGETRGWKYFRINEAGRNQLRIRQ